MKADDSTRSWPSEVFRTVKDAGITQVAYVPDAGLAELIQSCERDPQIECVSLTSEEEGVAMLAGSWLGGQRGLLLMQSSGVGNCINSLSLIQECRFPFLALVTMRGEWGEFNPWQLPMGQATPQALTNAGVIVQRADRAEEIAEIMAAAAQMAFSSNRAIAALVSQRVIGFKDWSK